MTKKNTTQKSTQELVYTNRFSVKINDGEYQPIMDISSDDFSLALTMLKDSDTPTIIINCPDGQTVYLRLSKI